VRLANKPSWPGQEAGGKPALHPRGSGSAAEEVAKYSVGQVLGPKDVFTDSAPVDVEGTSKGKGYQGVIKKHHMKGMTRAHGTHEYFRHGGSIGCRLTPQRVHKGKRMAGQMGHEKKSVQNLQPSDPVRRRRDPDPRRSARPAVRRCHETRRGPLHRAGHGQEEALEGRRQD
jgi:large subunit ribosomal protein L3